MDTTPSVFAPLWSDLDDLEVKAANAISKQLASFELPLRLCFEAGCLVSTVDGARRGTRDISISAMFLKRVLTDLRAIWLLLLRGYTSEAATIGATLFENALVVTAVAGDDSMARQIDKPDRVPWSAIELSKIQAGKWGADAVARGKPYTKAELKDAWQQTYFQYKWMCQLKHPSPQAISHGAGSTLVNSDTFAVLVLPDIRKEDFPVKVALLGGSLHRTIEAIKRYGLSLEFKTETAKFKRYSELMSVAFNALGDAMKAARIKNNPIQVFDRRFMKE